MKLQLAFVVLALASPGLLAASAIEQLPASNLDWLLTLGVDNVFEAEPPPGTRTGRFTGGSPYHDPIGRFYYVGVKVGS